MHFVLPRRVAILLVFTWITVITVIYYQRLWQLFSLGLADWIAENPSLAYMLRASKITLFSGLNGWSILNVQEALARSLASITGAMLVFIAALTLGTGVCALIRTSFKSRMEKFVFRAGIGLGVLAYISLGMAAIGVYRPGYVRLFVLGAAATGIIRSLWCFGKQDGRAQVLKCLQALSKYKISNWQVITFLAACIALTGALAPEIEYDALWYHLWLPRLWLEYGSPVDLLSEYVSLYPLTWELVYGAGMVLGGSIAAKLLSFSCLVLTAMVIYLVVRRYTLWSSAWVAIAIWITTPTVLWEATTAYVDLALGFFILLTVYSVIRYTESMEKSWIILAGISVGFSLGIKHLALIILVLVSTGLALKLWLASRRVKPVALPILIFVGTGLIIALPWYVRSWQVSRNPVFPEFYSVFGAQPPQRWDAITNRGLEGFKVHFGRPRTLSNLAVLPWDMTMHAARYAGDIGPIFLMLVPALLLYRSSTSLVPWLCWLVLLYILFWASPLSSFQMRFLVPIVPLLAMLAAEGFGQIERTVRAAGGESVRRLLELFLIVACLLNLPPFTSLHELERVVWDGWLTHVIHTVPLGVVFGQITETVYLEQKVPSYATWQYIDGHLAMNSRILTFSGGDHFYSHRQRIPSDATIARRVVWMLQYGDEQQLLKEMKLLGITHILFDKRGMADLAKSNLAIIQPEVMSRWYVKEYEDDKFILYRLVQE